jgi:Family of unknown function (DUF6088)
MSRLIIEKDILQEISTTKRGKIFFSENFSKIGKLESVNKALFRIAQKGILIRLAHGIYLYPKHDKELGILYPSIEEVAEAIAKRDKARIVPTGIQALNKLGLSTQVPLKTVYLTDGAARTIKVGNRTIKFKKTTPKNLAAKGEISKLVIQALREIGKDNITDKQIALIIQLLKNEKPEYVKHDVQLAPAWISNIMLSTLKNNE